MKDCNTPPLPDAHAVYPALGKDWKACAISRDHDGRPFRWADPDRIVHATIEWPLDPGDPKTIGATRCGLYDIPPRESWTGTDELTCKACAAIETEEEQRRQL